MSAPVANNSTVCCSTLIHQRGGALADFLERGFQTTKFLSVQFREYRGRDEIDRIAGVLRATHPEFTYQLIAEPEEVGDGGRVPWVAGRPGDAPAYAGTDFIIARDGRIAAIYLFFDKLS